jgi:hypothetical protein
VRVKKAGAEPRPPGQGPASPSLPTLNSQPTAPAREQQHDQPSDKSEHETWKSLSRWEKARFVFEALVAGAAVVGAVFLYKQIAISQDQLYAEKRPWILSAPVPIGGAHSDDSAISTGEGTLLRVRLKNSGGSPAFDTAINACIRLQQAQPSPDLCGEAPRKGRPIVPPDGETWFAIPVDRLSQEKMTLFSRGAETFWVITTLTYRDKFRPATVHHTRLCHYYSVVDEGWQACEAGNSAD